jgi:hypothetical protein
MPTCYAKFTKTKLICPARWGLGLGAAATMAKMAPY